jgi:hypothetical protein
VATNTYLPSHTYTIDGYSFVIESVGQPYSIQTSGASTVTFQLVPGDNWAADTTPGVFRDELSSTTMIPYDTPINVSYVMNIAQGTVFTGTWLVMGQFHPNDYTGEQNASPPFEVAMTGGKMSIIIGYSNASGQPVYQTVFSDPNVITLGKDYAMNISVTFDPNGNGHLVVTRDGVTIVNYGGPLGYTDHTSVYWKEGIYEAGNTTSTVTASYSNLSLTTGTQVTPGAWNNVQSWTIYDGSGNTLGTKTNTYDTSHNLLTSVTQYVTGAKTVSTYQITGQTYTSMTQTYDTSGKLIGQTNYYASGVIAYQLQVVSGVTSIWNYTTAGLLATTQVIQADGSSTLTTTGADGVTTTDFKTFNSAGQMTENDVYNSDGSKTVYKYQITGQPYASSVSQFNAAGVRTSLTQYYANGNLYYQTFTDSAGALQQKTYASNGALQNWTVTNADGSQVVSLYAGTTGADPIQSYTTINAAGKTTLAEMFDSSGNLLQKTIYNSDGSYEVDKYLITGQAYTSTVSLFNASGVRTSLTQYYANGNICYQTFIDSAGATEQKTYASTGALQNWTVTNSDGSKTVSIYAGTTGTDPIQSYTEVNAAGKTTLAEMFDSSGNLQQKTIYNSDGSYEVDKYLITGQTYTSTVSLFNASGTRTSLTQYYSNGNICYQTFIDSAGATEQKTYASTGALQNWTVTNADGSKTVSNYAGTTGTNPIQTYTAVNAAGKTTLAETFDSSGVMLQKSIYNSDGSYEVDKYQIAGQPYTSTVSLFNAAGTRTSLTEYFSNGTVYYQQFIDSAGATEQKTYTSAGILQNWTVINADGSKQVTVYNATGGLSMLNQYNSSGALTYQKSVNSDGSYYVYQYLITGQPYVSETSKYSASNALLTDVKYTSTGAVYSSYTSTNQSVTCFFKGTRIATAHGDVPVESLEPGDLVRTVDGALRPVRWIGRQTIRSGQSDPVRTTPIRIKAGALAENVPSRDLIVSPDHALFIGGLLIHAAALVNAVSIVREASVPAQFHYYHVELDEHCLILAEGAPAETFVDNIVRERFDNWAEHEALYPEGHDVQEMPYPRVKANRQIPYAVKSQLVRRAANLGERVRAVA